MGTRIVPAGEHRRQGVEEEVGMELGLEPLKLAGPERRAWGRIHATVVWRRFRDRVLLRARQRSARDWGKRVGLGADGVARRPSDANGQRRGLW